MTDEQTKPPITEDEFLNYLKNPVMFPPTFKDYLADYFATNLPKLPVSQIYGFKLQSIKDATEITTLDAISATAYSAAAHDGPSLDHIPNGLYIMLFGATFSTSAANPGLPGYGFGEEIWMSPSLDGSTPTDNDAAILNAGSNGRVLLVDFTTGTGAHTVAMRYKQVVGGGNAVYNRWLYLLKAVSE